MKFFGAIFGIFTAIFAVLANFGWVFSVAYGFITISSMATYSFAAVAWAIIASIAVGVGATILFGILTVVFAAVAAAFIK